ncbi:hypothetical protein ACW0JT_02300 [Arthrobacter sp. SA17]
MSGLIQVTPLVLWSRAYFAVQAIAGVFWWIAVLVSPAVREATLGSLNPTIVALFDIPCSSLPRPWQRLVFGLPRW